MHLTERPTEIAYYANHDAASLERIVKSYTDQSLYIALNSGPDHPLSAEAMKIANAAYMALVMRTAA